MTIRSLKNISIAKFESFLVLAGCKYIKTTGGHKKYSRCDLKRPIVFQSHIDPIPEFIIKNALRPLNISKTEFFDVLDGKLRLERVGDIYIKR